MFIEAQSRCFEYIGRWASRSYSNVRHKMCITSGRLRFKFTGQTLVFHFASAGFAYPSEIEYSIDGGAYTRVQLTGALITINGLAAGLHTVDLWVAGIQQSSTRWIDGAGVGFLGIDVDNDSVVTAWPTGNKLKMLVLGDSIAEGVLMLNSDPDNPTATWCRMSFIHQVCENLGIDCWNHSFGGAGFGAGMQYGVPNTQVNYLSMASGVPKDDPQFDIVVIESINNTTGNELGTIQTNYVTLMEQLKIDQPRAKIVCISRILPFAPDTLFTTGFVAKTYGALFIDTTGCSYTYPNLNHPDLAGHTALAAYVQPYIDSLYIEPTPTTVTSVNGQVGDVILSTGVTAYQLAKHITLGNLGFAFATNFDTNGATPDLFKVYLVGLDTDNVMTQEVFLDDPALHVGLFTEGKVGQLAVWGGGSDASTNWEFRAPEDGLYLKGSRTWYICSGGVFTISRSADYVDALTSFDKTITPNDGDVVKFNATSGMWEPVAGGAGGGIEEAPNDGKIYVRRNQAWEELVIS